MFIISLVPISDIPRQDILTYFYKEHIEPGTLVSAPYARTHILGLVTESSSLRTRKGDIKQETYQLKKIKTILHKTPLTGEFIEKITQYGETYFVPVSKILYDMYPKWYWDVATDQKPYTIHTQPEIHFIEGSHAERLTLQEKLINTHETTWICLPTVSLVKTYEALLKDTHTHVFSFHSKQSEIKQKKQFEALQKTESSKIIISTPYYAGMFLPLSDTSYIERASHTGFFSGVPYYYDMRALLLYIQNYTPRLFLSDDILPLILKKDISPHITPPAYTLYTKEKTRHNEIFIHPIMESRLEEDLKNNRQILLLTLYEDNNQKITCNDCNTPVTCPHCQSDLYLVTQKEISHLYCKFCKKKSPSLRKCSVCESWNLQALGVNKQTLQKNIQKKYKTNTSLITVHTLSDLELIPPEKKWDHVYIMSLDSLMYRTDYASEETLYTLLKHIEQYGKKVSIQTSFPAPNILNTFKTETYESWRRMESQKRKKYTFPPFGICYKIFAETKKGILLLDQIERTLTQKGIKYIRNSLSLGLYIPEKYEPQIDSYLEKKRNQEVRISKEKSLF